MGTSPSAVTRRCGYAGISHLDGAVLGGGGEHVAFGGERSDPRRVSIEGVRLGDHLEVPHLRLVTRWLHKVAIEGVRLGGLSTP